jgi:hypothetical protein
MPILGQRQAFAPRGSILNGGTKKQPITVMAERSHWPVPISNSRGGLLKALFRYWLLVPWQLCAHLGQSPAVPHRSKAAIERSA